MTQTIDDFTAARLADEKRCAAAGKPALTIVGRDLAWQLRMMQQELADGFQLERAYIDAAMPAVFMLPKIN